MDANLVAFAGGSSCNLVIALRLRAINLCRWDNLEKKMQNNAFLRLTKENEQLNQYWYSEHTITTMVKEIETNVDLALCNNKAVAFLSTPSVYFSLTRAELKQKSMVFDV